MRIDVELSEIAGQAIQDALGTASPAILRPTQDPKHGDFQVNGVLPLAKQMKGNPRELATKVAEKLTGHEAFAAVEVAGPGFINLRVAPAWLEKRLDALTKDAHVGISKVEKSERIVIDFSSPNIAKQMHVGHIRSTILGDAIVRLLRTVGHEVIGDNHLGDWGTQFGLLIAGMRAFGSEEALDSAPIDELERVYKLATAKAKEEPAFAEEARSELAKLQSGDPANVAAWERFVKATRVSLDKIYARLGVTFDAWLGESAYNDMLPGVVQTLKDKGLARESEGAMCVFFNELADSPKDLATFKEPFIVQKRDGAFLYSTTDIATAYYRRDHFKADRSLYVVGTPQSHHFKQLFAIMKMLGVDLRYDHIAFGSILGPDGKALRTREGKAVTLQSVLDEAEERALARIREDGLEIPEEEIAETARKVGIGAVKYGDLRQNRTTDYMFDWDKMISFQGNAGPYLQYAYARTRSLFRKAELEFASQPDGEVKLVAPEERTLGLTLLRFGDIVFTAGETYQPHLLCDHLYNVARDFSTFWEACPILKVEGAERLSRLTLTWLVGRQIATGLGLLGIEVVERM
ncbi:MAG: arginine--tRNA ligase [Polyangiaceae bacterium]|nr:arginine--tRNA ligase [Polyangiaceae bacterium]